MSQGQRQAAVPVAPARAAGAGIDEVPTRAAGAGIDEVPTRESGSGGDQALGIGAADASFVRHRGLVFALAYDITGSVVDAEDVAQSAYERWRRAGAGGIREPKAWLARVATNLAIDKVRAARDRPSGAVAARAPAPRLGHGRVR